MHSLNRTVSFITLVATVLIAVPAFAQETSTDITNEAPAFGRMMGRGGHGGRHGGGMPIMDNLSDEVKAAIENCHTAESMDDKRDCMDTLKDEFAAEFEAARTAHMEERLAELPEEIRADVTACHELEDRDATHDCMEDIREANPDAFPTPPMGRGRGGEHGRRGRGFMNLLSDDAKTALQACHTDNDGDRTATLTCVRDVIEAERNTSAQ